LARLAVDAEVKAVAHHVSQLQGGHGAARECCDVLLSANEKYATLLQGHLTTLDTSSTNPGGSA
jgi:3-deoxy-D-manno-octulosonate 8-phosphate phosphatase (KDO 8-P phosphatase)